MNTNKAFLLTFGVCAIAGIAYPKLMLAICVGMIILVGPTAILGAIVLAIGEFAKMPRTLRFGAIVLQLCALVSLFALMVGAISILTSGQHPYDF